MTSCPFWTACSARICRFWRACSREEEAGKEVSMMAIRFWACRDFARVLNWSRESTGVSSLMTCWGGLGSERVPM